VKGEKNFSGKAEIQEEDEESPGPMEKGGDNLRQRSREDGTAKRVMILKCSRCCSAGVPPATIFCTDKMSAPPSTDFLPLRQRRIISRDSRRGNANLAGFVVVISWNRRLSPWRIPSIHEGMNNQ